MGLLSRVSGGQSKKASGLLSRAAPRMQTPSYVSFSDLCRDFGILHGSLFEITDGSFAATAGTNNIGIHCAQLGGVYTLPSFRRRGCASFLLRRVCEELRSRGYSPVLFVRSENKAALALYEGCGFCVCGKYAISYY